MNALHAQMMGLHGDLMSAYEAFRRRVSLVEDEMGAKGLIGANGRLNRIELAVFGNPEDPKSQKNALVPTLQRANIYMDAACWCWRSVLAALAAAPTLYGLGKQQGWW